MAAGEGESEYLLCFLKELLRRYPTGGNLTVRTVDSDDFKLVLGQRGIIVPRGTPIHMPIWTLQNTTREWVKPEEFNPDRWLPSTDAEVAKADDEDDDAPVADMAKGAMTYPKCPYLASLAASSKYQPNKNIDPVFEGAGFDEDSLSYFPFSVGSRSCPAKSFAISTLSQVFRRVLLSYRLDPYVPFWEDDPGASVNSTVVSAIFKALARFILCPFLNAFKYLYLYLYLNCVGPVV